jgi:hypothetical protein
MSPSTTDQSPTPAQLRYLRVLAEQTGTTFVNPRTRGQASTEIDRLRQLKATTSAPDADEGEAEPEQLVYATAVQPGEVSGFGSTASWRTSPSPVMSTAPQESRVGERTELARYHVSSGERVLYGQRINGCVRITDRPACGPGRSYLVERELEQDGYSALKALVADYTLCGCPHKKYYADALVMPTLV